MVDRYRVLVVEAWRDRVFHRAALVAVVVGTVLTLINQGDALLGARPFDWTKALLTYLVPFCVNSHGRLSARRG